MSTLSKFSLPITIYIIIAILVVGGLEYEERIEDE
jgi:hypothetical protein